MFVLINFFDVGIKRICFQGSFCCGRFHSQKQIKVFGEDFDFTECSQREEFVVKYYVTVTETTTLRRET